MPLIKCTAVFKQDVYGWTESYFRFPTTYVVADELLKFQELMSKRILLSGAQTYITYLKLSEEGVPRDVYLYSYGGEMGKNLRGTLTETSDAQFAAALIRRQNSDNTKTSNLLLRGIWDRLVVAEGFTGLDPLWLPLWNSFKGLYLGKGWGFNAKNTVTSSKKTINTLTQDVNGYIDFTTVGNIWNMGQQNTKVKIFVSGVQGSGSVNGSQVVTVTGLNSCKTTKRIPILPYFGQGSLTYNLNTFADITQASVLRAVSRKTGRPLFLSRGRSRVRVLN